MRKILYCLVLSAIFISAPLAVPAQTLRTSSTTEKITYSIFSQVLAPVTKASEVSGQDPQMYQGQDPQMLQGQDPQMIQGQDPQMMPVSSGSIYMGQDPQMIRFR